MSRKYDFEKISPFWQFNWLNESKSSSPCHKFFFVNCKKNSSQFFLKLFLLLLLLLLSLLLMLLWLLLFVEKLFPVQELTTRGRRLSGLERLNNWAKEIDFGVSLLLQCNTFVAALEDLKNITMIPPQGMMRRNLLIKKTLILEELSFSYLCEVMSTFRIVYIQNFS